MIEALLFHKLGHYLQSWLSKGKLRATFGRKRYFFEMGGVIMNFGLAIILVVLTTVTTKDRYLLNENAVFGIHCSESAKEIGFQDGDKIISVNNERIEYFADNVRKILQNETPQVLVQRAEDTVLISIAETAKHDIISSIDSHQYFIRIHACPDFTLNCFTFTEIRRGLNDVIPTFGELFKVMKYLFAPSNPQSLGGFVSVTVNGWQSFLQLFALNSLLVGLINLIPLPGLDAGNTVIALIEQRRNRQFNARKLRIIRIVCSSLIVIAFSFYTVIIPNLIDIIMRFI